MIHPSIKPFIPQIVELFKMHEVKDAYLFGSVLTSDFSKNSDVDFIVNFNDNLEPLDKGQHWWDLYDQIKEKLGREVDIISEKVLKNPIFIEELNNTKLKIYG